MGDGDMNFEELEYTISELPNYKSYGIYRANPGWIDIKVYRYKKQTFYGKGATIEEALNELLRNVQIVLKLDEENAQKRRDWRKQKKDSFQDKGT